MQNFLKACLVLVFTGLGLCAFLQLVGNSPRLTSLIIKKSLARQDIVCEEWTFVDADLTLDGRWYADQLVFQCSYQDRMFEGAALEISVGRLADLIFSQQPLALSVVGFDMRSPSFELEQADLVLKWHRMNHYDGHFDIEQAVFSGYRLRQVKGDLEADPAPRLVISGLEGLFYDGVVSGEIILEHRKDFPYRITTQVHEMNIDYLGSEKPSVFEAIHGKMNVDVSVRGTRDGIEKITGSLRLSPGSSINALFLEFCLPYLPQKTTQRAILKGLIQEGGYLYLDDALFDFRSIGDKNLNGKLLLKSKAMNLNANIGMDINLDGGLKHIFNLMSQI